MSALLLGAAFLFTGHGLQSTLVPLWAADAGYSRVTIGLLWSAYAAGQMAGSIYCGRIIAEVGHVRAFAALAAGVAAMTLLYAFAPTPVIWMLLRLTHGFLIAGVYMSVESWLNDRATNELRGLVLSIYSALSLMMIAIGQLMINLLPPGDPRIFSVAGLAILLAVVPVALTKSRAPRPVSRVSINLRRLWATSRVAMVGSFTAGLTTSAYWGFGPVFGRQEGLTAAELSLYLSVMVMGGATCQWIAGRLSDYVDRRRVAAGVSLGAALCGVAVTFLASYSVSMLLMVSFVFGAFLFSLSSICIAMANDRARPGEFVQISGGLLFIFSSGSVLGAMVASLVMEIFGTGTLYLYTAVVHGLFAVTAISFSMSRAAVPVEEKRGFRQVPTTSPEAYAIDPRGEDERP
nr:MFS transporter [Govania unica]